MSNSVTVTVQLYGGAGTCQSFDLGHDGAAPPPDMPGASSDYDEDAGLSADAPPPAMGDHTSGQSASGSDDLPPPDVDEDMSSADEGDASADASDGAPPPPEA
jgi:hypothetical protein